MKQMNVSEKSLADVANGQRELSKVFAEYLALQMQEKALATGHTGTLLHGQGGMFNTPGLDQEFISLHVQSRGLGQLLPAFASNSTHPWFGLLTGVSDDVGSEPNNICEDAPAGYIKSGTLTAKFGRVQRGTNDINLPETLFKHNNGETMDLMLIGSIQNTGAQGSMYPPGMPNDSAVLNSVTESEMVQVGVRFERKLNKMLWQGLGTGVNDTPGGGYKEFPGLLAQITTGYVDAETNAAMTGADSKIIDFNYGNVYTTDIVEPIQEVEYYLWNLAQDTGVDPVDWVLVMRPMAWQSITDVWPLQYNTQMNLALLASTEHRINHDASVLTSERDRLRSGMLLTINGRNYPVVLDTGLPEENNGSGTGLGLDEFASTIAFVPRTINAGFPVLYWQYLDHRLSIPQSQYLRGGETWYTDGGRFLWSYITNYTCFKMKAQTDPRVVLRTPHLAAKITDVKYSRTIPLRDPDPANDYWVDGGVSGAYRNVAGPTRYAPWL